MRRRMLFSTLVVTIIAVLLLGLPLSALTYQTVLQENQNQLDRDAEVIAREADAELRAHGDIDVQRLTRNHPDRHIEITLPDGGTIIAGDWPGDRPDGAVLTAAATGESGARVEISQDAESVRETVTSAWLGIASLSLLAIGVAVGLAILQARRLTLPLVDLAATAERLGSGVATPWGHRYGIPEADQVAEVLDRSAERIAGLLATERHFATDASHQLRTPLTALSMRLEEMLARADEPDVVREECEAALGQTERLVEIVEALLGRARQAQHLPVEPVALDAVLADLTAEWRPVLAREGRTLTRSGDADLTAYTTRTDLAQILTALVENAVEHGAGTVTLRTVDAGSSVRIEVGDEGPGVPRELVPRIFEREVSGGGGTGLGLALARHIAESGGARVELVSDRPATFAIFLPAAAGTLPQPTGPA